MLIMLFEGGLMIDHSVCLVGNAKIHIVYHYEIYV